jgi:hypothetical protein
MCYKYLTYIIFLSEKSVVLQVVRTELGQQGLSERQLQQNGPATGTVMPQFNPTVNTRKHKNRMLHLQYLLKEGTLESGNIASNGNF